MIDRIYNEIDPAAAASIQAIMDDGVIPHGLVDTRSIKELTHADLEGRLQAHFFAGAGAWAYAARLAGWPDWWPLWTGSCPCQPFSQAGRGRGVADERHLWPDFFRLIRSVRPAVVVGEQVAGSAGYGWLDGVRADLEGEGYSCRAVDIPACAVDAPNIRQRIYWVALADAEHPERRAENDAGRSHHSTEEKRRQQGATQFGERHGASGVGLVNPSRLGRGEGWAEPEFRSGRATASSADAPGVTQGDAFEPRLERQPRHGDGARGREIEAGSVAEADGSELGDPASAGLDASAHAGIYRSEESAGPRDAQPERRVGYERNLADAMQPQLRHEPSAGQQPLHQQDSQIGGRNGTFWSDHEWLICHDGKARRTKPGLRLLADGVAGRVHQWRIAGNGINIPLAVEVLAALKDTLIEDYGWTV